MTCQVIAIQTTLGPMDNVRFGMTVRTDPGPARLAAA